MVVMPIEQGHTNRRTSERAGRVETAEAAADNYDVRDAGIRHRTTQNPTH